MYYRLLFMVIGASASRLKLWDYFVDDISGLIGRFPGGHDLVVPQDAHLSISQLAKKHGYPLETHTLVTEDGYVLNLHRIPGGRNVTNAQIVFLMHGIWESSDDWVLLGPGKALAYILADEGYDVWMGNARSNRYTLEHETLTPKMPQFWNFTWEEIGVYDLPAMIDYTLEMTGQKQLIYVGFSQGTTVYFVMNSMKPEYNKKIRLMFALAPEVFIGNSHNIALNIFTPRHSQWKDFLWRHNMYSSSIEFFTKLTPFLCKVLPIRCVDLLVTTSGPHHVNENFWPVILGHMPTGTSTLQFIHFAQLADSGRFCRFDYGREKNRLKYGQDTPPDFDLKAVTSPVILFYSEKDWYTDRRGLRKLKKRLPNVLRSYYVKDYSHIDYVFADDAATLVYSNIVREIKKLTSNDSDVI